MKPYDYLFESRMFADGIVDGIVDRIIDRIADEIADGRSLSL
jgi:hypothetical protein